MDDEEADIPAAADRSQLWTRRALGLDLPTTQDVMHEVAPSDIAYLQRRCPFLQLTDANPDLDEEEAFTEPVQVATDSGWAVVDYGSAMSASSGHWLFSGYGGIKWVESGEEEEEGEGGGKLFTLASGTVVNQACVTASIMVQMASDRGWTGIQVADGSQTMKWAAWVEAQLQGLPVEGFTPTDAEQAKYARLRRLRAGISPTTAQQPSPGAQMR